jgi:GT2 family glycosyltransferase
MKKPELSIVAVIIDNLKVTNRFLSSIKQYTKNYELILIDNQSKNKKSIKFIKESSDIYFRFNKRVSVAEAWNKGIELSSGKYIAIVNNDTVVPPDWFPDLKKILVKNKKAGMVSPITYNIIKSKFLYGQYNKFNLFKEFKCTRFKDVVWGEFCLFRRRALEDVGGYNEIYKVASGEDLEMCFMLYKKGWDIYINPEVFVYHQGGASQIQSIIDKKKRDKMWDKNFKLFKSRWPKYTKGW